MRVYKQLGAISNICFNLSMRNSLVLMYRISLNILIVYGRCTGTFDSPCIKFLIKKHKMVSKKINTVTY
jgi:hypothetical protein